MSFKILNGNELLVQGALEAGFHLYTGYPGSPLADFFNILNSEKDELLKKGIRVVIANSEANAAAMASGAKMAGQNVLVAMKSMGLHVASDALSVGNFANPGNEVDGIRSGVVVAVGDDPWSISTSTPADSRFLFKHLHMPFLEPSTPQELKDWMKKALELSQKSSVYVGILLTTFMAEGGGRVEVYAEKEVAHGPVTLDPKDFNLSTNVMVPPNSLLADKEMINGRFPKVQNFLAQLNLDETFGADNSPRGIIAAGGVFETLKQVLEESALLEKFTLYKAASTYPFNEHQLLPFLRRTKNLIVVEEKRGFLEGQVRDLVSRHNLTIEIFGKEFKTGEKFVEGFPAFGGLSYEIIYNKLNLALDVMDWSTEAEPCAMEELPQSLKLSLLLPRRLPTFCPGCPHRETLSIMKDIRATLADKNINLISHGDVGCYSLSFLEPFKEMHDLSAMGQGGALGAGTDLFTTNPSVVLMGDSTFFHSGMVSISNSVQMGHNITYILLDNDNTAMTGHQVTPRTGVSVEGQARPRQNMLEVANSLRVDEALEINPSDRYFYKNLLLEMVQRPGVKVIVSNKECGLTFHGRKKREERKIFASGKTEEVREFYQINTLACEDCRVCVDMTGCPGLSQTFDAYGTKVMIDPQICVSDSYCTKIKACPSFELVKVKDYHPTKYKEKSTVRTSWDLSAPVEVKTLQDIGAGADFRAIVIGVGGSGVTTISRVVAEAASSMGGRDDLNFKFMDQKGLAQRNGSVISHLSIYSDKKAHGPVVPLGSADLILSPDLLEGARAIEYLGPEGILIVDAEFQVPLSILLDNGVDGDVMTTAALQEELLQKLGPRVIIAPLKKLSYQRFQRPVYSSAMILGLAFQAGRLPFSEADLQTAFRSAIPKAEYETNWQAFMLGREWFLDKEKVQPEEALSSDPRELTRLSVALAAYPWQSRDKLINIWLTNTGLLVKLFPGVHPDHLAKYVHDIVVYDQGLLLGNFYQDALELKKYYQEEDQVIALRALAKTYWIKDEVFVSHLMISPLKTHRDRLQYADLGSSFEVVHINRPAFELFGKKIEFDFSPKPWMLKIMRHLRILRMLMPEWHDKERKIALEIRTELLTGSLSRRRLKELDNIKGYREVRYRAAQKFLGQVHE
ncbi:MAG TPA: 2-oxoacid:acceptor oxidoreductase family protein [Bacteriovoracaceae bacterium]|nr:2-oxoacid:acceptor oxidoreductase family protein [Bacteriovoracaceae bacterium]